MSTIKRVEEGSVAPLGWLDQSDHDGHLRYHFIPQPQQDGKQAHSFRHPKVDQNPTQAIENPIQESARIF